MSNENSLITKINNQVAEKKFIRGDYDLGFTFWGVGFGGILILISVIAVFLNTINNEGALYFFMALFFVHSVIIAIATWRSSNQYTGPAHWAVLAKISVIILSLIVLLPYLYFFAYLTADYPNH
jgi:uncharacterized membrane protein HdeD (DUF308 family)